MWGCMKKKIFIFILMLITIVLFTSISFGFNDSLMEDDALSLGEDKYLEFLWMVDGAFNDKEIRVNNKILEKDKMSFTCEKNNHKECIGKNFPQAFNHLFSKNISYEDVYSDKESFYWMHEHDDNFYFSYSYYCNHSNMENYSIKVNSEEKDKITYEISNLDSSRTFYKLFVLIKEDNEWKVSEAFYRDNCMFDYYIK